MEPGDKKRRKGENFSCKEKQMIVNVLNYFKTSMSVSAAVKEASKALCCSERSVYNVQKEQRQGPLSSPKSKNRKGAQINDRLNTYDDNIQALIRRKVHAFFKQNIPPTLNTILAAVNNDEDLPHFTRATLHRLLHDTGFEFNKVGRKSILMERDEIIRWRHKYLRDIKKFREQGRNIIYTDESWVNVGHTVGKAWNDTSIKSIRQAYLQGLTTGLKSPSGLGPRFALVHAGCEKGFITGAELTFLCKKNTADAHQEMDADKYEEWFIKQLLPNLPQNSIIVLDNASYHTRKMEKIPTTAWRKEQIIEWLNEKQIPIEDGMLKRDLLVCVSQHKPHYDKNKIDEIAKEKGHEVLRLPPYHCELNPIEMVWAQVKHYIKMNNTTFKVKDMSELIAQSYNKITAHNWQNYIEHVKNVEKDMWTVDNLQDDIEQFIIHVTYSSTSEEESDNF